MFLAKLLNGVAHYLIWLECAHPLIYDAVICIQQCDTGVIMAT